MLIDITKFLIISIDQFNTIITTLNCNLTNNDPCYLATYLLVNIIAYLIIFIIIKIIIFCYYQIFSKKGSLF